MSAVLVFLIRVYQRAISPLLPPACRYTPSCSAYTVEAIQVHGAVKGSWLGFWRIMRCHPFHPGGTVTTPTTRAAHAGPGDTPAQEPS